MDKLMEADAIVDSLGKAMQSGETGLRYVPALLLRVIDEDLWRERVITKTGLTARFDRFVDFVTTEPLDGLGADLPLLHRLCCGNPAAQDALDRVTKGQQGGDRRSADFKEVHHPLERKNGKHLRRLRKDFPDLHEQVLAGRKNVTEAAVEAGIYPRRTSINTMSAHSAAASIREHCDRVFISNLIAYLSEALDESADSAAAVARGIADADAGRVTEHDAFMAELDREIDDL